MGGRAQDRLLPTRAERDCITAWRVRSGAGGTSVNPESRLDDTLSREVDWRGHVVRAETHRWCKADIPDPKEHREHVEPWLSALFQAEHLNVLVGSGLTTAIACAANAPAIDMSATRFGCSQSEAVAQAAQKSAKSVDRERPNIEDQLRTVIELIGGLRISGTGGQAVSVRRLLGGFLLPLGSRAATRERTHIFTTNYDRLIEYGCDLLGLRVLDRFVGNITPVFHSSRLGIDLHYNPPGIRGEPRYLVRTGFS